MNYIIVFMSLILGALMNLFYMMLDLIGTPYIWLCIVLFALSTRFLFLRGKIRKERKRRLKRVIDHEITEIQCNYLSLELSREQKKEQKRLIRAVHKKYNVPQGSGCLIALLQLPLYFALYNVVRSPQIFVGRVEALYANADANSGIIEAINKFFGLNIIDSPVKLGIVAYIFPILIGAFILYRSRSTLSPKYLASIKKKFFRVYVIFLLALQVSALTYFSFTLPLGMSIYWLTNDVADMVIDHFVKKRIDKDEKISKILEEYDNRFKPKTEETKESEA